MIQHSGGSQENRRELDSRSGTGLDERSSAIQAEAHRLGFGLCGICPAVTPRGFTRFREWLEKGYAGEMRYLANRQPAYQHPRHILDGARSLVVVAKEYRGDAARPPNQGEGRVSRYAWGDDYHESIRASLGLLADFARTLFPAAKVRGVVDTAPLLERDFAQLAGIGWIGKNTMLINKYLGSWLFLAALVLDVELAYDDAHFANHCGTCRACLDACPTDAFVGPYELDARRCISYLTVELRSSIPAELREGIGDWIFGCDVCQEVCPWNRDRGAGPDRDVPPSVPNQHVELYELFLMAPAEFQARFRHTSLWRAKRSGLLRNAAVVLGNRPAKEHLPALLAGLSDEEPLVRGASAWALGRHLEYLGDRTPEAWAAARILRERKIREPDDQVRLEIDSALTSALGMKGAPRDPT